MFYVKHLYENKHHLRMRFLFVCSYFNELSNLYFSRCYYYYYYFSRLTRFDIRYNKREICTDDLFSGVVIKFDHNGACRFVDVHVFLA